MKAPLVDCPVCHGQGLAFDYARGEWGPEKCRACDGSGRYGRRSEAENPQNAIRAEYQRKKDGGMPNRGATIARWTPEEVDHLVSFGVKAHIAKYPNRTEKAASLRLAQERTRKVRCEGNGHKVESGAIQPGDALADQDGRVVAVALDNVPPADEQPTARVIARLVLPISLSAMGKIASAFGEEAADMTVRQVGDELWFEARG